MLQISSVDLHIAENPVMKSGFSRFQENNKRQDFGNITSVCELPKMPVYFITSFFLVNKNSVGFHSPRLV